MSQKKIDFSLKQALHLSYKLGYYNITHLLLKSGHIGPNNKDTDGNTLLHKALRDKKIHFLKQLLNYKSLSTTKKNRVGDTALNMALNIINAQAPDLQFIKILTRKEIDFTIKNRYYNDPLDQAQSNVHYFHQPNRRISKFERKKRLQQAQETFAYLNLVCEYQNATHSKTVSDFIATKTLSELFDISLIASYQNQRNTLIALNKLNPSAFSWKLMIEDAQREGYSQAIPFFLSQLN